jgi:hypothetical protein
MIALLGRITDPVRLVREKLGPLYARELIPENIQRGNCQSSLPNRNKAANGGTYDSLRTPLTVKNADSRLFSLFRFLLALQQRTSSQITSASTTTTARMTPIKAYRGTARLPILITDPSGLVLGSDSALEDWRMVRKDEG